MSIDSLGYRASGDLKGPNPINSGTYGEGAAFQAMDQLKQLRAQLDSGKMSVKDFLAQAQPIASGAVKTIGAVAGKGSKAANIVNPLMGQLKDLGFIQKDTGEVIPQLGDKYEQQLRTEILPSNTPEGDRNAISQIPTDIPINSDRGQIEREGIREGDQAQAGLDQRTAYRASALNDLAGVLSNRASQNFQNSIPQVAEDANSAGVFRSTGYGNALAQKQYLLQQDVANQIGMQGIADRDTTAAGMGDITNSRIANEQAGLNRQFTLDDFTRNKNATIQMGDAFKPQPQGKTNGEKWAQGAQIAVGAGSMAASASSSGGGKKGK